MIMFRCSHINIRTLKFYNFKFVWISYTLVTRLAIYNKAIKTTLYRHETYYSILIITCTYFFSGASDNILFHHLGNNRGFSDDNHGDELDGEVQNQRGSWM